MRCLGILDDQSKGAWSSLFAVAGEQFKAEDSAKYIVPYAKFASPSDFAQDAALTEKLWNWTETELNNRELLQPLQNA
jgi:hypothetical protein